MGKSNKLICGLMSGTSLDGIDCAIVEFADSKFKLKYYKEIPYADETKQLIKKIISDKITVSEISFLNIKLSYEYAEAVKITCEEAKINLNEIVAVGLHGQTVWHNPENKDNIPNTLQLGSVSTLSNLLNLTVVGDFRTADMTNGGQGAPLVPIFDFNFLKSNTNDIIALNIGGIANITYLPKDCEKKQVIAFDTGPGNILIDSYVSDYFNLPYDKNGEIARSGKLNNDLFNKLKKNDFIYKKPPKSTGRELFNLDLINKLLKDIKNIVNNEDIINTLTKFTAYNIAENIRLYANPKSTIIASGGGVKNHFLMELLHKELLLSKIKISDEFGIPYNAKEAISFAYLAYLTLNGKPGNIKSVTGAKKECVLGIVAKSY